MVKSHSDDWSFDFKTAWIIRIGKHGDDTYNMCGLSCLLKEEAAVVALKVQEIYKHPGYENMFWNEILNRQLNKVDMVINLDWQNQIMESDIVVELQVVE